MNSLRQSVNIIVWLSATIGVLGALISCNKENAPDCFQSAGSYTTVKRDLETFTSIELNDYIQVELYDTNAYFVEITAPRNLIPDIHTDVKMNQLKVENKNTCNFVRSFKNKITVRIYSPDFADIQNRGTGDITSINTLNCTYFKLENRHASGTIKLDLQTDTTLIATHTGVSDCILRGNSGKTSLFNQGLGIIDARALVSNECYVNNSSINDVYVHSNGYMYSAVYFSGNIYYAGQPTLIDFDRRGTGSLIKLP